MRYDFSRLSPEQFEDMAVSLCVKAFGFETKVYGAGPDGQREFTYNRPFKDNQGNEFTGMTFGQVKYRNHTTKGDEFSWLKNQFESEMEGLKEKEPSYRPKNYFFITNIILTPVKDYGIRDKLDKLAANYHNIIPNIFFMGYDDICKMLDNNLDVRSAYTGLIMPGDVLSLLLNKIRNDFAEVLKVYIRSAFSEDIYTRIEQAGSIPENMKTLIAEVGIDLIVEEETGAKEKALELFIETGNMHCSRKKGRFIVIGGAGKGKSTITQFLAQIYRASYLEYVNETDEEIVQFLSRIRERFSFTVRNCRIPFVIEIKRYADWIVRQKEEESISLLAYITCVINRICDSELLPKEVFSLFNTMPWLIVLDGLDEVPESSNRKTVLAEIERFMSTRLPESFSDCMIIATSRAQGYGGEFDNKGFLKLEIKDLLPEDCLKYLTFFFNITEQKRDNREQYLETIKKALHDSEKASLLSTPLQATIMAIIVKSGGNLPNNRYDLFRGYCDVIIKREAQKEILPVLNDDTSHDWIYKLHQRLSLYLQAASDSPDNPAAEIELTILKKEINSFLEEYLDPYVETNPENVDSICLRVVIERICFLTETRNNVFSFSIRSMQEFFAGIALVDGKENDDIQKTLLKIARKSYWRNTLLFAVGHLVRHANNTKTGAILKDICEEINGINNFPEENYTEDNYCRFGSYLAVDLLAESLFLRDDQDRLVRIAAELCNELDNNRTYSRLVGAAAKRLVDYLQTKYMHKPEEYLSFIIYILPLCTNPRNNFGAVIEQYFNKATKNKFEIVLNCMIYADYLKVHNEALLDKLFAYYLKEINDGADIKEGLTTWGYCNYIAKKRHSEIPDYARLYIERQLYCTIEMFNPNIAFDETEPLFSKDFLNLVDKILKSYPKCIIRGACGYKNVEYSFFSSIPDVSEKDVLVSRESSVPMFPLLVRLFKDRSRETYEQFQKAFFNEPEAVKRRVIYKYGQYGIAEGDYEKFKVVTDAENNLCESHYTIESVTVLDREGKINYRLSSVEEITKEKLFDDLERFLCNEIPSEEILMNGINMLITLFDATDDRYMSIAHAYLDMMQGKGVFFRRTLSLLWLLFESGDKEYVCNYRLGKYKSGVYDYPLLMLDYDDVEKTLRLLEAVAYDNLQLDFWIPFIEESFLIRVLPCVEQSVVKRLEKRCANNPEYKKMLNVLKCISDFMPIEELLKSVNVDNENDRWQMYNLTRNIVYNGMGIEKKRHILMSLIRWFESSEDQFEYRDFVNQLRASF